MTSLGLVEILEEMLLGKEEEGKGNNAKAQALQKLKSLNLNILFGEIYRVLSLLGIINARDRELSP